MQACIQFFRATFHVSPEPARWLLNCSFQGYVLTQQHRVPAKIMLNHRWIMNQDIIKMPLPYCFKILLSSLVQVPVQISSNRGEWKIVLMLQDQIDLLADLTLITGMTIHWYTETRPSAPLKVIQISKINSKMNNTKSIKLQHQARSYQWIQTKIEMTLLIRSRINMTVLVSVVLMWKLSR